MSTLRTALAGAGLGAILVGAAAPTAAARIAGAAPDRAPLGAPLVATAFGFSVSPAAVRPGGTVTLTVTGCTEAGAYAESAVFDRINLGAAGQTQSASTTVDTDARIGAEYDVTFTCGTESGTAPLSIVAATASPTPTATATVTASPTASSTSLPSRGAQAGVGGTQPVADGGSGGTILLAAAGITALAAGWAAYAFRGRPGRGR
ncbi:hypothetical protein [Streptomyces sp. RFCAC02]|uniref:hypothetical protein n=1 Tax=Streptomyces sp. RFCAC02 TaxID=2499143 RepID=UPI0010228D63|nr:hypothetical protein [Streptomyces sp. RFCAC02]